MVRLSRFAREASSKPADPETRGAIYIVLGAIAIVVAMMMASAWWFG